MSEPHSDWGEAWRRLPTPAPTAPAHPGRRVALLTLLDGVLALLEEGAVTAEDVSAITLRFSHSGRSMIDQNELKSHRAQYILPIGLYNRKVVLDDILFEPRDTRIHGLSEHTRVVGDDELERFYPDRYPSSAPRSRDIDPGRTALARHRRARGCARREPGCGCRAARRGCRPVRPSGCTARSAGCTGRDATSARSGRSSSGRSG